MFERLNTPQELYNYKLGAALKMERTLVDMLGDSAEHAQDPQIREMLLQHREETRGHVANVERVFGLFGWDVDDSPCPAIHGIEREAKANIRRTDDAIVDAVILSGASEAEHHEIAVYENLIVSARAMGHDDAAVLLQQNLAQELAALGKVSAATQRVVVATIPQHAAS
jgi:ferritin-like metal-binding protein YciE